MANDSYTQQALAGDLKFQTRLRSCLSNVAWEVIGEPDDTEFHEDRETFARQVINQIDFYARQFAPWIVMRPNISYEETTYNFSAGAVVTAATDAAIESQLMSDWNNFGGIGAPPPVARGRGAEPFPPMRADLPTTPPAEPLPLPPQPGQTKG
jgi:hypothetical protein